MFVSNDLPPFASTIYVLICAFLEWKMVNDVGIEPTSSLFKFLFFIRKIEKRNISIFICPLHFLICVKFNLGILIMKGSVWSSLPPINFSSSEQSKPIILMVASLDSASFFRDKGLGADSPISVSLFLFP